MKKFLVVSTLVLLYAYSAMAETTSTQSEICAGLSASVSLGEYNLTTGKMAGGIFPGVGYGATYKPDAWYATGVAAYLSFSVGGSQPNQLAPTVMVSFANYVRVGIGALVRENYTTQWRVLFGMGSDFGASK